MDYNWITTFPMDFTIADKFGTKAIKDTYNRAFKEWKNNTEYVTELAMVLNHKIFEHYYKTEMETDEYSKKYHNDVSHLYDRLWRELDEWCCNNLKGEDLDYYYRVTD